MAYINSIAIANIRKVACGVTFYWHLTLTLSRGQGHKISTAKIERNGNRMQTESGKRIFVFCHCSVIRTLSLAQEFSQMC